MNSSCINIHIAVERCPSQDDGRGKFVEVAVPVAYGDQDDTEISYLILLTP